MVRLVGFIVLSSIAAQVRAQDPQGWQVLVQDAMGKGTRTFLPAPDPRPLGFFEHHEVAWIAPGEGSAAWSVGYQPLRPSAEREFREIGNVGDLVLFETGLPCTHGLDYCNRVILAGPSTEALRPIYLLHADPAIVGRIDPSEIFSRHGRSYLRNSRWARGAGYAGYYEEYWLLQGGLPVNLRLTELSNEALERIRGDGWEGTRFCGPFAAGWLEPDPGPPGFIPTEDGVIMYVCVVRSPWTPESDLHPRTLRVRFSYEDSRLSFVDFDVGP